MVAGLELSTHSGVFGPYTELCCGASCLVVVCMCDHAVKRPLHLALLVWVHMLWGRWAECAAL
jgi:hypothetical protein